MSRLVYSDVINTINLDGLMGVVAFFVCLDFGLGDFLSLYHILSRGAIVKLR